MAEDTLRHAIDPGRVARRHAARRRRRLRRGAIVGGVVVLAAVGGNALARRGEVAPSVHVAGVDVGGLSHDAAADRLRGTFSDRLERPIAVHVGSATVQVVPAKAGVKVNVEQTVEHALGTGRLRASLMPFVGSDEIAPAVRIPKHAALPPALAALEHPPKDAKPAISPDGHVSVAPSATGIAIDARTAVRLIALAAVAGRSSVTVPQTVTQPKVTTAQANAVAADARQMLSRPVQLTRSGKRIGAVAPGALAPSLDIRRTGNRYYVDVDPARLVKAIDATVAPFRKAPVDATWTTDGRHATLVKARDGVDVDALTTARAVRAAALGKGARSAAVAFGPKPADLTTAKAKALGVTTLVSSVTTDLGDSSSNRIHNVELMAQILDGHLVLPHTRFSFNDVVGPRDASRGFLEGQAIVNGLLVPSIGGGVCQVATTVFGAAFYAGLPVSERTNHSFYISHYDLGMDATVSWGGPDLIFENDTDYGILVRTSANDSTMTVNFYSTPHGISVDRSVSGKSNFSNPQPRYVLDPSLPPTAINQTTSGEGGFDVTVSRTVKQHGRVIRQDSFTSHYVPEDIIYRVGAKARVPAGATIEPPPTGG